MGVATQVRRFVPSALRPALGRIYHGIRVGIRQKRLDAQKEFAERVLLPNTVGQRLYYGTTEQFSREHAAVAAGRTAYRRGLEAERKASFLLRRNVHRIEKGLIMPNRRAVFALDFLEETVAEFEAVADGFAADPHRDALSSELQWAQDVLAQYFEVTDRENPVIAAAGARFEAAAAAITGKGRPEPRMASDTSFTPFASDLSQSPVSIEALTELSRQRRSVRTYSSTPVPRSVIDAAIDVAAQSPSACNRQAFSFHIFDEREIAQKVAAVPAGTRTFVKNVPHVAVLVGHLRAYPRERDRHAIYVDASLAAMAFIYGLQVQGVGSCAINWADEEPAESRISQMLGLAPDDRVIVMVSFGWPAEGALVPYSAKRERDDIRKYPTLHQT